MTAEQDDRALLSAWAEGDAAAGQRLVRRYFGPVYGFFRNKLNGELDDIVQRTFLGCLESLPRFRGEASFRTYLFAIARNQLLMELRRRHSPARALHEPAVTTFEVEGDFVAAEAGLAAQREQVLLLRALRRLPVDDQVALELFYWENLTSKEIAEVLERPHATVRTRLRRAREALLSLLGELSEDAQLVTSTADGFERWVVALRDRVQARSAKSS
ncbi:MAG: sigma-70 family RNA polymerase sigma factor [Myxococcota bacterium]